MQHAFVSSTLCLWPTFSDLKGPGTLALTPDNLAASISHNTQSRVPKYGQYICAPNGQFFTCDMLKLLH